MSSSWAETVERLHREGEAYVLVTVIGARGSTPRDSGSKMVVTAEHSFDTIGGGHLEFQSTRKARELLVDKDVRQHIEHFPLGASLGQCCGGSISVLFERFEPCQLQLQLFGAGHVAKALVPILGGLPCRVQWVDEREAEFPESMPGNTRSLVSDTPSAEVANMPAGSYYLILTHNHQLDYELCEAILRRGDARYVGLIGSETKWRRFQQRFQHRGIDAGIHEQIHCPVGNLDVPGKRPMEVAVSIAAQIIQHYQSEPAAIAQRQQVQRGLHWKDIKRELATLNRDDDSDS